MTNPSSSQNADPGNSSSRSEAARAQAATPKRPSRPAGRHEARQESKQASKPLSRKEKTELAKKEKALEEEYAHVAASTVPDPAASNRMALTNVARAALATMGEPLPEREPPQPWEIQADIAWKEAKKIQDALEAEQAAAMKVEEERRMRRRRRKKRQELVEAAAKVSKNDIDAMWAEMNAR